MVLALRGPTGPATMVCAIRRSRASASFRTLIETGLAINSELSLDGVLKRIVEAAAQITGAQYAALGVIDPTGTSLERFITHGIDDETRAAIGDLPSGRGVLGVLITDARTLRLHELADDPALGRLPAGASTDDARSSAYRSSCAASPTATSI